MSYRPEIKTDQGGATIDFPLDAETIRGKSVGFLTITNASGTLTSAQYSELTKDIALIKYGNKVFYKEDVDSSNKLVFVGKTNTSVISNTYTRISQDIVTIDTTTRAYEYVENALINTYTNTQIDTKLSGKQDTISDLATIRSGASAGATAVQPSDLSTVATSGSYNDLSNKPTIPTVNNGTLTIQKNGTNVATFTANQSGNATANISVPTKTSDITNDSNFTTKSYVDNEITNVVEIAEGKTKNYVISDVAISGYENSSFNSTNATITLGDNQLLKDVNDNVIRGSDLKIGDIVSIFETDVPDRWVGQIQTTGNRILFPLETKLNIANEVAQNDTKPVTSGAVYAAIQNLISTNTVTISSGYSSDNQLILNPENYYKISVGNSNFTFKMIANDSVTQEQASSPGNSNNYPVLFAYDTIATTTNQTKKVLKGSLIYGDPVDGYLVVTKLYIANREVKSYSAESSGTGTSLVTTGEKYTWNNKYDKPSGGIPDSDIASVDASKVIGGIIYKATTTYSANDVCIYNGKLYVSAVDSNIGHTPSTSADTSYWVRMFV